jgi:two-component system response regulator FlrC|tara:strand:+ start:774 stop:2306 length:1533 start_codon:yes stop_codon:yes gene_type:complete
MYQEQSIDLIWDESSPIDTSVMALLTKAGFLPQSMGPAEVARYVDQNGFGPCVLCMHRRELPNIEMIRTLKQHYGAKIYLVLRVAPGDLDSTIEAIKCGVDDVISDGDDQLHRWEKIASLARLRLLKNDSYVFVDETSQHLLALVERVGAAEVTALMCGPTGSGKEVLAHLTHDFSPRRDGPFIPVNCAALPEALAESLLFGHAKGAFTGATKSTDGFFTQAQGGTLFLDEIGELTLALQAKLLRAIQEKEILPVGSAVSHKVDVRIVAATNRDLRAAIRSGMFREDLYFRVSTFRINVPGLSARLDDILPLANYFLVKHGREEVMLQLAPEASAKLLSYSWPGNVRELENVIQRAIVLTNGGVIDATNLIFDDPIEDYGQSYVPNFPPSYRSSYADNQRPQEPQHFDGAQSARNTAWSEGLERVSNPFAMQTNNGNGYVSAPETQRSDSGPGLQGAMDANEFRIIVDTIKNTRTRQEAADVLGISQRTLRYKIARMRERGIQIPKRRSA